jgi:acyl-CoA synthetase (AMP-forming)/AMP-acid ligase II
MALPGLTIPSLLDYAATEFGDQTFLVSTLNSIVPPESLVDTHHLSYDHKYNVAQLSFVQFRVIVVQVAECLQTQGIKKGDRCAFVCNTSIDTLAHILAVSALGGVVVPINNNFSAQVLSELFGR